MVNVAFFYSKSLDEQHKSAWQKLNKRGKYPASNRIRSLMATREKVWRKTEGGVIGSIERTVGVSFSKKRITCYVVGRGVPNSEPLTLPIFITRPATRFVDTLAHELVHRLFSQKDGAKRLDLITRPLRKKYPKEPWNVILHVAVDAVLAQVYRDVFTLARAKSEYRFISSLPEYKRAWDIVFALTPQKILGSLKT